MSYWSDRQEQLKKMAETDEEAIKKRLKKHYDKELRRLDREIAAYFQKYGENNVIEYRQLMQQLDEADRTLLIEQMDEFAEKYPQYAHLMPVRESIYKLDRLQGLQYSVNIAQANIAGYTEEQIRQYETKLAQKGLNYSMETLGFGKNFYSINDDIVKSFVGVAWCNGENFSERIWNDTQKVANYINQDMAQAFARGDAYRRIAQDLQRRFGTNYTNAYRLVFTEGTYVMAESSIKPFEGDFEQYEYSPILDGKTCPICRALAGKVFLISERQPGVNFPPMNPWCRCSWEPYVENWDKWMDDYVAKHSGDRRQAEKIASNLSEEDEKISEIKDFNTLSKYFKKRYNIDIDKSVQALDFESVKEGLTGVEKVINEFPQAQDSIFRISTDKHGVMSATYDGIINFNPIYYKEREKAVYASRSTGFHPKGNDVVSTGSHEMGHILEKAIIDKSGGGAFGKIAWADCTYAKAILKDAQKSAKKTAAGKGKRNAELVSEISGYAKTNASECLAEAVADYILNGDNAAVLSREIWKILKGELG